MNQTYKKQFLIFVTNTVIKCILETGKRQAEAIRLYKKSGYDIIPNYGQYAGIENSVCFKKDLV